MKLKEKLSKLKTTLVGYGKVAIAFSGGVDSSFLVFYARKILGRENTLALTVNSPYMKKMEVEEAKKFTEKFNINHRILELSVPQEIERNPLNRCYLCKKAIFSILMDIARKADYILCDGTNATDIKSGDRPGIYALNELGVKSPLASAGITKEEIRKLSKKFRLPVWNKPPYSCLLTRLEYNTEIENKKLYAIDKAEDFLISLGFSLVRVRVHNDLARIEVGKDELKKILDEKKFEKISKELKKLGFRFVTVDCEGYRTGG